MQIKNNLYEKKIKLNLLGLQKSRLARGDYEIQTIYAGLMENMNPEIVFDKERIYEKISGYDAEGDSRVGYRIDSQDP